MVGSDRQTDRQTLTKNNSVQACTYLRFSCYVLSVCVCVCVCVCVRAHACACVYEAAISLHR